MKIAMRLRSAALALVIAGVGAPLATTAPGFASEIKYVVNNVPITSYDIQRRAAFLKLQRRSSASAKDEMIEQALKSVEMRRLNVRVPDKALDDAYARFASGNKMSVKQLDGILAQTGVTKPHFREFIRVQMGWSQAIGARFRAEGRMTEQDAVQRMLQQGGAKPSATEYMLQQVIFVVPAAEKGKVGARKKEAEAMRQRFAGCDRTRSFAKGLIDVTVRDLGRVLAPELPPEWEKDIKALQPGGVTPVRQTDRGVEFIGVCSSREVSDDRVAQMVFQNDGPVEEKADELGKKYIAELKEKARIIER